MLHTHTHTHTTRSYKWYSSTAGLIKQICGIVIKASIVQEFQCENQAAPLASTTHNHKCWKISIRCCVFKMPTEDLCYKFHRCIVTMLLSLIINLNLLNDACWCCCYVRRSPRFARFCILCFSIWEIKHRLWMRKTHTHTRWSVIPKERYNKLIKSSAENDNGNDEPWISSMNCNKHIINDYIVLVRLNDVSA